MILGGRIQERLDAMGMSQAELARRVNLRQSTINGLVNGGQRTTGHLHLIAKALNTTPEYLTGETDDPKSNPSSHLNFLVAEGDPDSVEIESVDLEFGMGGTFLDTVRPISTKQRFAKAFIEQFTGSPPELLFVAKGLGDSMNPTIQDNDLVLVDRAQTKPKMRDKIWAMALGDVGMVKRLRPQPDGTMLIISDNPNVSDDRATDGELHVIGRVVAIVRKV